MSKILKFDLSPKDVQIKKILSKEFLELDIYAISDIYPNRNDSAFTLESLQNSKDTCYNKPILGCFNVLANDFEQHNGTDSYDKELQLDYWDTSSDHSEKILGLIRESDSVNIVNVNGQNWLKISCALWTYYSYRQVKKLLKSSTKKVSVEVEIIEHHFDDDGIMVIDKFVLNGITILGDKVTEGIPNAHLNILDLISTNTYNQQAQSLCFAYKQLNNQTTDDNTSKVENTTKEDFTMTEEVLKDEEVIEEESATAPDTEEVIMSAEEEVETEEVSMSAEEEVETEEVEPETQEEIPEEPTAESETFEDHSDEDPECEECPEEEGEGEDDGEIEQESCDDCIDEEPVDDDPCEYVQIGDEMCNLSEVYNMYCDLMQVHNAHVEECQRHSQALSDMTAECERLTAENQTLSQQIADMTAEKLCGQAFAMIEAEADLDDVDREAFTEKAKSNQYSSIDEVEIDIAKALYAKLKANRTKNFKSNIVKDNGTQKTAKQPGKSEDVFERLAHYSAK